MRLADFLEEAETMLMSLADDPSVTLSVWATGFRIKKGRELLALFEDGQAEYYWKPTPKKIVTEKQKPWRQRTITLQGTIKRDFLTGAGSEVYHFISHPDSYPYKKILDEAGRSEFGWYIVSICGQLYSYQEVSDLHSARAAMQTPPSNKRLCGSCRRLANVDTVLDVLCG